MIRIMILVTFLIFGYALGWSGRFRLVLKSGSTTERVLETIHLGLMGLLAVFMFALPPMTDFQGRPELAYSSGAVLITALALFNLKTKSLILSLSPASGSRAKPVPEQRRTKWPYSFAWATGYILAAWYVATIYAKFG
jgi:hypothetical protein